MSTFSLASTIEASTQAQNDIASKPIKSTIKAIASGGVELSQSFRLIAKTINEELRTNLLDTVVSNIIELNATATKHGISVDELQALRASL